MHSINIQIILIISNPSNLQSTLTSQHLGPQVENTLDRWPGNNNINISFNKNAILLLLLYYYYYLDINIS